MADSTFIYRVECAADVVSIHRVNSQAFETTAEANLVDALRTNGKLLVSLVAESAGVVVGHIAFSPVIVESDGGNWAAVGLAPVAVLPEWQNRGVGSELIRRGLEECAFLGHPVVFVLGHPPYYPRFGFVPTASHGISCTYEVPPEAFMVAELQPGALAERTGVVRFAPEFDAV